MALEQEIETYNKELSRLIADEGKYVVICGTDVIGIYGTYEDALNLGYEKCGVKPFLVKKIQAVEQVQFFTRELDIPCHS